MRCAISLLLGLLGRQGRIDGARAGDVGDVAESCELSLAVVPSIAVLLTLLADLQRRARGKSLARSPGNGWRRCEA